MENKHLLARIRGIQRAVQDGRNHEESGIINKTCKNPLIRGASVISKS